MEKKILLVRSESMDSNKKKDRNENSLLRVSKQTRSELNFKDDSAEVYKSNTDKAKSLTFFKAFAEDVKIAKILLSEGKISKADMNRICFVSSKTYAALGKKDSEISEATISKELMRLLIGTDPELLLMQDGNIVHANNIPGFNKDSKFGSDGAMAEIRPDPASSPEGLIKNIKKLFEDKNHPVENHDWVSACYYESAHRDYPVGTHIHIDNPKQIKSGLTTSDKHRLFAVTNKIMDELLTIPMIRLDGKDGHKRRARCKMSSNSNYGTTYGKGYGFFGEWRGKHGRLEYRSLSGLVISNPKLCEAVFGTAMAIAEAVYKKAIDEKLDTSIILPEQFTDKAIYGPSFKRWGDIPLAEMFGCTKNSKEMADILDKSCRKTVTISNIKSWHTKMRSLSTYSKYSKNISYLADLLASSIKSLDTLDKNIKNNWR